jgi:hypothetical protein
MSLSSRLCEAAIYFQELAEYQASCARWERDKGRSKAANNHAKLSELYYRNARNMLSDEETPC